MRQRSRTVTWTARIPSKGLALNGSVLWDEVYTRSETVELSRILDVASGKGAYNPVFHKRSERSLASVTLPLTLHESGNFRATVGFAPFSGWRLIPAPVESLQVDWTEAMQELLADATGEMPLQASLVVNAVEAATLRDLIPGLLQAFTGFRKHKWTRKSLKDLAGSHLAYSFGLAPLIQDFKGVLGTRRAIQKRIQELEARNGRTVRIVKRKSATASLPDTSCLIEPNGEYQFECKTQSSASTLATVSANVASFFVPDQGSQCKLWASALGLSSPLTNAWELVPFSFVIDWFVPIGSAFKALESKLGLHETVRSCVLSDYQTSVKQTIDWESTLRCRSTVYPGWDGLRFTGDTGKITVYNRTSGIPSYDGLSSPSGWSMNRTALSISLLAQKSIK